MSLDLRALAALGVLAVLGATSGACGGASPTQQTTITVVTTTSVFADLAGRVGGERVRVHALVPRGGDVHTFDPAPSDAQAVSGADLIVMNGLGLDTWLEAVIRDAGAVNAPLVRLAESVDGADYIAEGGDGAGPNPHLWMDVTYARAYASLIASALAHTDPPGEAVYQANLAAYDDELADLDAWIKVQLAALPAQNRRVVSFHDAFPYFARAYGLEIVGVLVDAPGQEPSAGELAELIEAIRSADVKAILSEVQFDDRLVQTVAAETGARVVQDLYDDSVGDPPLDGYDAIMRFDTEQLLQALR